LLDLALQLRKTGGRNRLAAHNLKGISSDFSMGVLSPRVQQAPSFPDFDRC